MSTIAIAQFGKRWCLAASSHSDGIIKAGLGWAAGRELDVIVEQARMSQPSNCCELVVSAYRIVCEMGITKSADRGKQNHT